MAHETIVHVLLVTKEASSLCHSEHASSA